MSVNYLVKDSRTAPDWLRLVDALSLLVAQATGEAPVKIEWHQAFGMLPLSAEDRWIRRMENADPENAGHPPESNQS